MDAGAELHSALSLPSSCCWEVPALLCVLVLCSGQGGKGRVGLSWDCGDTGARNGEAYPKVCPVLPAITGHYSGHDVLSS